jgi:uridylate kinase
MALAYTRALLKLSGEALGGEKGSGLDFHTVEAFAQEIKSVDAHGVHHARVVGGVYGTGHLLQHRGGVRAV